MSKGKSFIAMQKMVNKNMDISMSTTILGIDKHRRGAVLQVGVDEGCIDKLASNDYMFLLLVVNKKEFAQENEAAI